MGLPSSTMWLQVTPCIPLERWGGTASFQTEEKTERLGNNLQGAEFS